MSMTDIDISGDKQVKAAKIPAGYERAAELAKAYFEAHSDLRDRVDAIAEAKRKAGCRLLPGLKRRIATASATRDELSAWIDEHADLFRKPRTRALHGVKLGLRQLPGRLEIDEETAIELIRERMPDRAKTLIKVTEKLQAGPVKNLQPAMLARIGGRIVEPGDETVIRIAKSDVDKLVEALLAELDESESEPGDPLREGGVTS